MSWVGFPEHKFWDKDFSAGSLLEDALGVNSSEGVREVGYGRLRSWSEMKLHWGPQLILHGIQKLSITLQSCPETRGLGLYISIAMSHWMWAASGEGAILGPNSSFWPEQFLGRRGGVVENLTMICQKPTLLASGGMKVLVPKGNSGGTSQHPWQRVYFISYWGIYSLFGRSWDAIEGFYIEKYYESELYLGRLIWLRCLDWIEGRETRVREECGKLLK